MTLTATCDLASEDASACNTDSSYLLILTKDSSINIGVCSRECRCIRCEPDHLSQVWELWFLLGHGRNLEDANGHVLDG
jgi:hypothetical protein